MKYVNFAFVLITNRY